MHLKMTQSLLMKCSNVIRIEIQGRFFGRADCFEINIFIYPSLRL